MDFARKQLEKYGWTDGKGLGKNENGIAQALKPKLKRSVAGIGHDAAADFTEHWWTQLYNKAAGNVEVEEKDGKTKKIKTKDTDEFEITNSTWKLNKKKKKTENEEQYADYFVRKAVLTKGGSKMEKTEDSAGSDSETEAGEKKDVFKMTDEELFAACEGRTAHKGARHGLKATGKLARIAEQEQILLTQSQYDGYSHAKKRKAQENLPDASELNTNEINDSAISSNKKHKKKKKSKNDSANELETSLPVDSEKKNSDSVASNDEVSDCGRKSKKNKYDECDEVEMCNEENSLDKRKKKRKRISEVTDNDEILNVTLGQEENVEVSTKKVKKKKSKKEKSTHD